MKASVVVSEKGQVTIPKRLRDSLRITPGTELLFEERAGMLVATRVVATDPIERLVGLLPRMDVDKVLTEMRGPNYDRAREGGR